MRSLAIAEFSYMAFAFSVIIRSGKKSMKCECGTLEIISIILNMINYSVVVYHIATCDVINLVLKTNNEKLKHCGV